MCRFAFYLGDEIPLGSIVSEPAHSIIRQSIASAEQKDPVNGDGFGVAWYASEPSNGPTIFKEVGPAWNNTHLLRLARSARSSCMLAHVRAATTGLAVCRPNCHPFSRGPFAFVHNGSLASFVYNRSDFLATLSAEAAQQIHGTTDSEFLFALFTDHFRRRPPEEDHLSKMGEALTSTILQVEEIRDELGVTEPSLLNLAVCDGKRAVCSRYASPETETPASLYLRRADRFWLRGNATGVSGGRNGGEAVIVASEPITPNGSWQKVKANTLLLIAADRRVESQPLG